jgi:hypothetical protein
MFVVSSRNPARAEAYDPEELKRPARRHVRAEGAASCAAPTRRWRSGRDSGAPSFSRGGLRRSAGVFV